MQDRAVFRNVDFVAAEHGLDAPAESAVLRQPEEQFQGLPGYAIFRVIQVQADRFDRHALAAGGILRKKLAQMQLTDLLIVTCKALPCLALIERRDLLRSSFFTCMEASSEPAVGLGSWHGLHPFARRRTWKPAQAV